MELSRTGDYSGVIFVWTRSISLREIFQLQKEDSLLGIGSFPYCGAYDEYL